jgi:hypothetical protein
MKSKTSRRDHFARRNDRMRKKMLYYGYQMAYDQPRTEEQKAMSRQEVCFANVSAWCAGKHCKIGKPLEAMTGKEVQQALTQFEAVYKSFLKSYGSK